MIEYTHFSFASGASPYITTTPQAKKSYCRMLTRKGYGIKRISQGFYLVNDRKEV